MKHLFMIYKLKLLTGVLLLILPVTLRAQCSGSWSAGSTLNYLCADGPFLQYDLGANICPATAQGIFTFTPPVQSVKLTFSAFGSLSNPGDSRMSVFLNNSVIDLSQACGIILGCQTPIGEYSIDNGCLVDSISGADGGISGAIYLKAASFGLPSITSIAVAVSEPNSSGTIFELDSCYSFGCTTGLTELTSDKEVIYPNPFHDKIIIRVSDNEKCELNLFDITARKLINKSFTNSISINTGHLAKGIYLYEVRNQNGVIKKGKVVKE